MPDYPFPLDDPYPAYARARERGRVQWSEPLGAHLVLAHAEAAAILRDPSGWSSDPRHSPRLLAAFGGPGPIADSWTRSVLLSDPPEHTRLRGAISRFFTPRAMARVRERIAAVCEAALEPAREGEPIDLMAELAYPIPLAVICELLDVDLEGAELLRDATPTLTEILELDPGPGVLEAVGTVALQVMMFLVPLIAARATDPGEDLISALLHPAGGEPLSVDEVATMCLLLLAAGHETTANLIGNGTLALLRHPEQLAWLAEHPEAAPAAVEELLRYEPPVQLTRRVARADAVIGGHAIAAGEVAIIVTGAVGRDPAVSAEPDRLWLARPRPTHLAFGLGPHFCAGAGLARLEAAELFARLPAAATGWDPDTIVIERDPNSRVFRRLRALWVTPAGVAA